jgi:hypothetical protein
MLSSSLGSALYQTMVPGVEVELAEIAIWGAVASWGAYSQIRLVERDRLDGRFGSCVTSAV